MQTPTRRCRHSFIIVIEWLTRDRSATPNQGLLVIIFVSVEGKDAKLLCRVFSHFYNAYKYILLMFPIQRAVITTI